ncbi:hypothetical protein R1sor_005947 [Riccia sorocarpa]|uniref:Uncharacterized protein n=1 Tax=Riccia sorocarpa TaxID=122646 RepID=A0ABD3HN32_9MARC
MGRSPCCDKANVNKRPWSSEEDALLKNFIEENGTGGNWITLPSKAGLRRCGKSSSHLPGRTDNDIKNYLNTRLKKKLWDSSIYNVYRNLNSYPSTSGQTYHQLGLPDYGGISAAQASSLQLTQNSFGVNQEPQYYSYYNQQQQHLFPQHPAISASDQRCWRTVEEFTVSPGVLVHRVKL